MKMLFNLRVWVIAIVMLMVFIPASALAAPVAQGATYGARISQTERNCGGTQVKGTVLDESGNHIPGVTLRLITSDGNNVFDTTAGAKSELGASGWDFSIAPNTLAADFVLTVTDGSGGTLSNELPIRTTSSCDQADSANVVTVEVRRGANTNPPSNPQTPPSNPPANPPANPAPPTGSAPNTEPAPPLTAGASCAWYTQTAGGQGGFSVCDDGNARFRTAFNRFGLQNIGYPISTRYRRDGFITQAFQKAVLQWRPDGSYVAFVNTFDELHNRGFDQRLLSVRQTPFQLPDGWDTPGATFNQVVARRQALLNVRPALRSTYFSVSDPITFFGLPTSEVTNMGNHYAIRLQRAVLQEWTENVPWARAGQVTVANGGDIAKELGHLPASNLTPESAPPAGTGSTPPAAPPSAPPSAPAPNFVYGIQAHMIYVDRNPIYSATRNLGFTWLKQQIEWKAWEPEPGAINWGEMDGVVDGARANGLTMLFSVVGAPGWAREAGYDPNVAGPPSDPQTFANFVGAIAGRYCGRGVGAIEVWNEQNLHYEWGNKPLRPADYVNLLRPAYTAIKAACPSMIVVSGALTPAGNVGNLAVDDFTYLEGMLQNGAAQYADVIGSHPSGFNVPPSLTYEQACNYVTQTNSSFRGPCNTPHHSWSFRSTVDGYYAIMQRYNAGNKKIWATEFGWAAGGSYAAGYEYANDNTFDEQAAWTVEAYQYMRSSGRVGAAFLWNLNFRVIADRTEKAQWGILSNSGAPLPAYNSLQAMPK